MDSSWCRCIRSFDFAQDDSACVQDDSMYAQDLFEKLKGSVTNDNQIKGVVITFLLAE